MTNSDSRGTVTADARLSLSRRTFLTALALSGTAAFACQAALAADSATAETAAAETADKTGASSTRFKRLALGLDNFAVRAMEWKADALIDYAAKLKLDSLFISDLDALASFEPEYLKKVRARATDTGLALNLGTWSICPSSTTFKNKWGTAEEHLALGIRVARDLGSPVLRVVLGHGEDRGTPGGIDARIDDTVRVCKSQRTKAIDANVKIAVENHAGDLQSTELVRLIEEAGRDYVGANMDSGNAVWALEDPLSNLETLGPYALTTSLRDSALWTSANGFTVAWTAMGEGQVDWKLYFSRFAELCPETPVHVETISGFNREFPVNRSEFWQAWPKAPASRIAPLYAMAMAGKERAPFQAPAGKARKIAEQDFQRADFERSIEYLRGIGLGRKNS